LRAGLLKQKNKMCFPPLKSKPMAFSILSNNVQAVKRFSIEKRSKPWLKSSNGLSQLNIVEE